MRAPRGRRRIADRAGGRCLAVTMRRMLAGLVAGAAGTLAMDLVQYAVYRRGGGTESFGRWEFGAVRDWDSAPAPAKVLRLAARRAGIELADSVAGSANNLVHWAYGTSAGAAYALLPGRAGSMTVPRGAAFGSAVWLSSYATLPLLGLYQPIWRYDARTLGTDLSHHLVYGTTVAVTAAVLR